MKTKLLRVFALFASVLVLVTCLIVPMSADSFDSSRPLVEDAWEYMTVIDVSDFSGFGESGFLYDSPSYVIIDINGDRYSICSKVFGVVDGNIVFGRYGNNASEFPYLWFESSTGRLIGENSAGNFVINHVYSYVSSFSIIIYSNSSLGLSSTEGITVNESMVIPTSNRITSVFTNIMDWITSGLNSVQGVFYANNQLTMLGTLAVIGVSVGVAFLIIGVVQKFLKFRS